MGTIMNASRRLPIILLTFFLLSACTQERDLLLIANSTVPVYDAPENALAPPPRTMIAELQAQQQVAVIKCSDVKHYQIYKIRLPDGRVGYINEGSYMLVRNGERAHC